MGVTLVHEHVLVDFAGAEKVSRSRYDADEAFRTILPHLQELQERGCRTLFECTPAYLGRDPLLLRRLSEASGLHIVTNTGYYGAANDIAVPRHAYAETARQLADRWTAEARGGIEGTGIRPGFVKIGVDAGPALRRSTASSSRRRRCATSTPASPSPIHTGDGAAALEILARPAGAGRLARGVRLGPRAEREGPRDPLPGPRSRARGWSSTGSLPRRLEAHVEAVVDLARRDRLDRVLVSQDAGWYHVGEPAGGEYRPLHVPVRRVRAGAAGSRAGRGRRPDPARREPGAGVRRPAPGPAGRRLSRPSVQRSGRPTTTRPTSGGSER